MNNTNDVRMQMLAGIQARAEAEARVLANEFARAAEHEREEILAAMEYERWLAEGCADLRRWAAEREKRPG